MLIGYAPYTHGTSPLALLSLQPASLRVLRCGQRRKAGRACPMYGRSLSARHSREPSFPRFLRFPSLSSRAPSASHPPRSAPPKGLVRLRKTSTFRVFSVFLAPRGRPARALASHPLPSRFSMCANWQDNKGTSCLSDDTAAALIAWGKIANNSNNLEQLETNLLETEQAKTGNLVFLISQSVPGNASAVLLASITANGGL